LSLGELWFPNAHHRARPPFSPDSPHRARKGIKGRPIRVGVVGYPNTGKSTLINKLVGKKRCKAENQPGVTRGLTWVKVKQELKKGSSLASGVAGGDYTKQTGGSDEFELLDTPGIIPKKLDNHLHAHMLAACNAVGRKGYDGQRVAAWLLGWFGNMAVSMEEDGRTSCLEKGGPDVEPFCRKIYGIDIQGEDGRNGELALHRVAENKCKGDLENAANKVLQDFRSGRMGRVALQTEGMERVVKGIEGEEKWTEEEELEDDWGEEEVSILEANGGKEKTRG
jgi:ribosome biogenesis GTPase A